MSRRWFSLRAIIAHLGAIAAVVLCLAAARWQVHRAASGNLLSYGYAVEWPLFAVAAVVVWWQFIHDAGPRPIEPVSPSTGQPAENPESVDDPALRSYNEDLTTLAATGRRKSWRNPRGLP